ncbi:MAG: DUF2948 family protein [Paracoccaceae bacterium]
MTEDQTGDARFEEAPLSDRPVRLRAEGAEDLAVISALLQDAVGQAGEILYARARKRLVLLVNRFRWEDRTAAERAGRPFERVRAALTLDRVARVRARGIAPGDAETVYSILTVGFESGEDPDDPTGRVRIMLAGDGEVLAEVECLEASLDDLTRPWAAAARRAPDHGPDGGSDAG